MDDVDSSQTRRYGYSWYVTVILMVAYTFSFLDRQILNLMVGPIEADLHITDVQFALLTGGAFAIFHTTMCLPIAWLADRFPRKWIITAGIAAWSLMTTLSGMTRSFAQLVVTRIGVGAGEAALSPSAYSMLTDLFDRKRLSRAMSVYAVGVWIGAGTALIVGGTVTSLVAHSPSFVLPLLGPIRSWHLVFIAVGLPGFLVALWTATIREPRRGRNDARQELAAPRGDSLARIFAFLKARPRMAVALFLGSAFFSILGYIDTWYPELFIRQWHWEPGKVGLVNGVTSLTAGPLGMLSAGWLCARMIAGGKPDACLRVTAGAAMAVTLPAVLMPVMPSPWLMGALLLPIKFFCGFTPVLIPTAIQMVAPVDLRAQLSALFLLTVGIVGVSLGPLLPALFNDYLFHSGAALGLSLALASAIVMPITVLLLRAGFKEYRDSILERERDAIT